MTISIYESSTSSVLDTCSQQRPIQDIKWWEDLPWFLKDLVVRPHQFQIAQEYEMLADRIHGHDSHLDVCYCAFRYVLTQLRSDGDELLYEVPVYAETKTSWRLHDNNWLVLHKIYRNFESGACQSHLTIMDAMPR